MLAFVVLDDNVGLGVVLVSGEVPEIDEVAILRDSTVERFDGGEAEKVWAL